MEWLQGRISTGMLNDVAPDANGRQVYACGPAGYLEAVEQLLREVGVDDTSIHLEYFTGDRQTLVEYADEVGLASEIAEGDGVSADEAAAHVYGPEAMFEADGIGEPVTEESPVQEPSSAAVEPSAHADTDEIDTSTFRTVGEGQYTVTFLKSQVNVRLNRDDRILRPAQNAGVRIPANCEEGMCGSCKSVKLSGEVDMTHQGGIRAREVDQGKFLPCCSTPLTNVVVDA